jgi:hypothetical protein
MKRSLLLVMLVVLFSASNGIKAQSKTYVKQHINFESNASDRTKTHKKTLNKLLDSLLKKYTLVKVFIKGNTDNVGDSVYNKKLSQLRSTAVKQYLLQKNVPPAVMRISNFGEDMPITSNDNEPGKLKNRRVELIILYVPKIVTEEKAVVKTEPKKTDPCGGDTTIKLSQGSTVRINKCDYGRMKDCITISEFTNQQALINSDLTTMTTDNTALISGGMFTINLCSKDTCLKKPIIMRVPYNDSCLGDARLTLWDVTISNRWGNSTSKGLKLIKENGKKYYEFEVYCSGGKNLDIKINNYIKYNVNINFTMKSKRVKLLEVRLAYDCPNAVISGSKKHPTKTIGLKGFCPDKEPFVYAIAVTKRGDTLEMEYTPIRTLTHKDSHCHCEKATIKTGAKKTASTKSDPAKFPLHKRYYLKKKDFEKMEKKPVV